MSYSVVYSSQTGNTARLAEQLKATLPEDELLYCGVPDSCALEAETIFVGFWTDKGDSDRSSADFLKTLSGKRVFLFGTAGFGGSADYYDQILNRVKAKLNRTNTVIGSFMCQGKMPLSVRKRYESMQLLQREKMQKLIENFDQALSHPDQSDLDNLAQSVRGVLKNQGK